MPLEPALFLPGVDDGAGNLTPQYSARHFRMLTEELFTEGVLRPDQTALRVRQRAAGANFSVDVDEGSATIEGDDQAYQGVYLVRSTSVENLGVEPAPGAGLHRVDLVVAEVLDAGIDATNPNVWRLRVIAGQAVADTNTPPVPSVPPTAVPLAEIGPITSTTASITDALIASVRSAARLNVESFIERAAADLPSAWPRGVSLAIARTSGAGGDWPVTGTVMTAKVFDSRVAQMLFENNGVMWMRHDTGADAWTGWRTTERRPTVASVTAEEATTSDTYVGFASGPELTNVFVGPSGLLEVRVSSRISTSQFNGLMSYRLTGPLTREPSDERALWATGNARSTAVVTESGLPQGLYTVSARYRSPVSGQSTAFALRRLEAKGIG